MYGAHTCKRSVAKGAFCGKRPTILQRLGITLMGMGSGSRRVSGTAVWITRRLFCKENVQLGEDHVRRWLILFLSALCVSFVVLVFVNVDCASEQVVKPLSIAGLTS